MNVLDQVMRIVQQALDEFDSPAATTSSVLRKAIRVARLRNDFDNLWWLELEMNVIGAGQAAKYRRLSELLPHYSAEEFKARQREILNAYCEERKLRSRRETTSHIDEDTVCALSVPEMETRISTVRQEAERSVPPPGLAPVDLYYRDKDMAKVRQELNLLAEEFEIILHRIRQRLHMFLSQTERELAYGQANADIFERTRRYVDERIKLVAPSILDQFTSAYRRMSEGDPEARSQALTSCRRILKALADHVYPPPGRPVVGADGKPRNLNDQEFISRLWQFVFEKLQGNTSGKLLREQVEGLGRRIDRLNELSSKGVHDKVTLAEGEQCVIQTYLLVGDILRLHDETSALQDAS